MAVIPINVARVSNNLRAFNLLQTVRGNEAGLFRIQNQIATGLRFNAPSEDPARASAAGVFDRRLDTLNVVQKNLGEANAVLTEGEAAMADALDLLLEANNVASEAANDAIGADERRSLGNTIDSILRQTISTGNRRYLDSFLFAGRHGGDAPFEQTNDGVLFRGDDGRLQAIVDDDFSQDSFTISGSEFFNAVSTRVNGFQDLNPSITTQTLISDLRGTGGTGVRLNRITVSDGTTQNDIDLTGAVTVGDLLDRLNAEMPGTLVATLAPAGLLISPTLATGPHIISVSDVGSGQAARDLGIATTGSGTAGGVDLDPRLNPRQSLATLNNGAGLSLAGNITIRNGTQTATVNFATAETLEDVLNTINQSNVGVWARIAPDGRSLEVLNRVSGSDLYIEESGGQAATSLGIRSTHASTPLSELNDGRGVDMLAGNDIRVITSSGASIEIDVDGAATLQDIIDRFNTAGGGAIRASLAASGNGLVITDNTAGSGPLRIERVNLSPAIDGLGLNVDATGNQLIGRDVNPIRVDSPFTALIELRDALRNDDQRAITAAGERLEGVREQMQAVQGRLASQAKAMDERAVRMENESSATRVLLSDVRDVDLTEAVVRFQQVQTALQANLSTASRVLNLSLLDYLR